MPLERLLRRLRRKAPAPVPATLLTRPACGLCDELLTQLEASGLSARLQLELLDVDSTRELKKRFGLRIPVLLVGGEVKLASRTTKQEVCAQIQILAVSWQIVLSGRRLQRRHQDEATKS